MKKITILILAVCLIGFVTGCRTTTSATPVQEGVEAWDGEVFVTQDELPDGIAFEVLGTVEARAGGGYSAVETLYPLLADEARKIGANAVIETRGGRRPSGFSWSAPFTNGTAVKVESLEELENIDGSFH